MKTELLKYLLEAGICQAVFYLFYRLFLKQDTFFIRNRFYLLVTSCLSLIIPGIELSTYREADLPDTYLVDISTIPQGVHYVQQQFESHLTVTDFMYYAYVCGVAMGLIIFIRRLFRILFLIRNSNNQQFTTHIQINTDSKLPTFSFFHYLFWNDSHQFQSTEANQILKHELTHIQEKHSLDIIYMELLQIGFWFNPFIYLYKLALQDQHEFRADFVVAQHYNKQEYSRLMVENIYKQLQNIHLTHSFGQSFIKKRIAMINKPPSGKAGLLKMIFVIPVGALLLFAFTPNLQPENLLSQVQTAPDTTAAPSPSIVLFTQSEGSDYREIDLSKGISVKQFPDAIHARAISDPEYRKTHPNDARYRVAKFKVMLVQGRRPTIEEMNSNGADKLSLVNIKKEVEPGNRLYIEIIDVHQLNAQYQVVNAKVDEQYKIFNVPITE